MPSEKTIASKHKQVTLTITTTWQTVFECLNETDQAIILAYYEHKDGERQMYIALDGSISTLSENGFETRDFDPSGVEPPGAAKEVWAGVEYLCPFYDWINNLQIKSPALTSGTARIFFH